MVHEITPQVSEGSWSCGRKSQARDRDMDRHTMQGEVGYLFSRLGRGKGRREKSREREKQKGRRVDVGRMERGRNCLFWGEMEKGRDPG